MPLNVQSAMGFLSKTQIREDSYSCPDDVDSRPDELIHKASHAFKIQTFGRRSSWPGHENFVHGNCVHQIHRPDGRFYGPDAPSLDMEIASS
jgi:hypothetical protein